MYEACFKLKARPFLPAPMVSRYFPAAVIESARQTLTRAVERGEGPGLLIGPAGTGKSLLCRLLADEFASRLAVVLLDCGRVATRRALLQEILYGLDLPYRGLDEGELRLSLVDFLEPKTSSHEGLLLVVDEAHSLPLRLLEELRMLTNLVRDGKPRVRVVLAGSPLLEERFASPKLGSFSQRMAARCYLEPLDAAETAAYVRAQITACGGDAARLLDEPALTSIYRASDGVPRLINQICDHALILASLGGIESLTSEAVEEAWADLQQLPPPHAILGTESDAADNVVEFGTLKDEEDELPEAIPFHTATRTPVRSASTDEQLDVIEQRLSQIDEGFERGTAVHGQVELEFRQGDDSLDEDFEEEEIVLDRYASDYEIFADIPRVTAWHGQSLGLSVAPAEPAAASAAKPQTETTPNGTTSNKPVSATASLPPVAPYSGGPAVSPPAAPTTSNEPSRSVVAPPAGRDVAVPDVELPWAGGTVTHRDRAVVAMPQNPSPTAQGPPPKKEYKQLFARLRRS